ncbi:uncharacterized protein LOC134800580 [Cydia splendana]|uniref:uncharacterized protein LOC134800580 n=1 Tax=Cydia splendana TaxID=1100963 RepID=UPI00300DA9FD
MELSLLHSLPLTDKTKSVKTSYITLVSGTKLLIIGEYSYSVRGRIRDQGFRFKCSSYLSKGCKAFAHVTKDDVILKANTLHNHPPSSGPVHDGFRYTCSNRLIKKCKAHAHVTKDDVIKKADLNHNHAPVKYVQTNAASYITTTRGTRLLYINEYTFCKNGNSASGIRYTCSSRLSKECNAYAYVDKNEIIYKSYLEHNHPPTKYLKMSPGYYVAYKYVIHNVNKTKLLMINNFSYFLSGPIRDGGARYTCSSYLSRRCKAFAHVSKDDVIMKFNTEHNHPPTQYTETASGLYIKVLH